MFLVLCNHHHTVSQTSDILLQTFGDSTKEGTVLPYIVTQAGIAFSRTLNRPKTEHPLFPKYLNLAPHFTLFLGRQKG